MKLKDIHHKMIDWLSIALCKIGLLGGGSDGHGNYDIIWPNNWLVRLLFGNLMPTVPCPAFIHPINKG